MSRKKLPGAPQPSLSQSQIIDMTDQAAGKFWSFDVAFPRVNDVAGVCAQECVCVKC